jgi:hypothetical protein
MGKVDRVDLTCKLYIGSLSTNLKREDHFKLISELAGNHLPLFSKSHRTSLLTGHGFDYNLSQ